MAATPEQLARVQQVIATDPRLQALIAQFQANPAAQMFLRSGRPSGTSTTLTTRLGQDIEARLAELGVEMPKDAYYNTQGGQVSNRSFWDRNADWLVPAIFGGAIGAGVLAAPAAAGSTTAASTTAGAAGTSAGVGSGLGAGAGVAGAGAPAGFSAAPLASTVIGNGAAGTVAGGSGLAGAGAVTGGGIGGTLSRLGARDWLTVGAIGSDALGRWWAQRQADRAAGRELDMSREALALEKEMFEKELERLRETDAEDKRRYDQDFEEERRIGERDYADMGPYRNMGTGALSRLAFGVGIPDPNSQSATDRTRASLAPPAPTPMQPWTDGPPPVFTGGGTVTGGSLASLGSPQAANVSSGGMTTMRTPTGQTVLVPAAKVQEAIANGGTVLSGAA